MYLDPQAWPRTAGFPRSRILRLFRSFCLGRCLITGPRARWSVLGEISRRRASDAGHPVAWCEAVSRCGYIATDRDRARMHACLLKTGLETRELLCVSLPDQRTEQARVYRSAAGFPRLDRIPQTPITPCRSFPRGWERSFLRIPTGFWRHCTIASSFRRSDRAVFSNTVINSVISLQPVVAARPPRVPGFGKRAASAPLRSCMHHPICPPVASSFRVWSRCDSLRFPLIISFSTLFKWSGRFFVFEDFCSLDCRIDLD